MRHLIMSAVSFFDSLELLLSRLCRHQKNLTAGRGPAEMPRIQGLSLSLSSVSFLGGEKKREKNFSFPDKKDWQWLM